MDNLAIAAVFNEIADLLEIKGENPFRIRSYRNGAEAVEALGVSLKSIVEEDEKKLETIPGVGPSIHKKIVELIETGRCEFLEGLLEDTPPGLLDILKVSGVGPRKAAMLYKEAGISNIEELESAAREQRLRELPGMGEKSEQKILKALVEVKRVAGRFSLDDALRAADAFIEYLKELKGVAKVEPAGSLRRWKETIGDLDILVTSRSRTPGTPAVAVMDHFVNYPEVIEVVLRGETKSTVILASGMQVDLRVLDEASFGSALQYFTGSKAHNVAVRDMAKRAGLKLNEYGVFNEQSPESSPENFDDGAGEGSAENSAKNSVRNSGARIAGATEEDVYRALGLDWVPPELREGRGELEAAREGTLPDLVELKHIRGDLHMHTSESDGADTLEAMAKAAMARGYEYMAVTEHSSSLGIAGGLDEKRLLKHIDAIDRFNEAIVERGEKFRVLKGTEVEILAGGTLDYDGGLLERLDCVVGAVHSGFEMGEEEMTGRILSAFATGHINILAHPTGRLIGTRNPYAVDIESVVRAAREYGVMLELNSYPDRLDLNDVHLALARKAGVLVSIATDSHGVRGLGNMLFGVHTARRGWLTRKDVLNTRGLKEVRKLLKGGGRV